MLPFALTLLIAAAAPLSEDPGFKDAVTLYDELELEQAVLRLQELALDSNRPNEERAEILVWLGLTYAQLGRFDDAKRNFELAVRANREVELPRPAADKVRLLLEDARKSVPREEATAPAPPPDDAEPAPVDTAPSTDAEPVEVTSGDEEPTLLISGLRIGALGSAAVAVGVTVLGVSTIGAVLGMFYVTNADPSATQVDVRDAEDTASTWPYVAGITVACASVAGLAAGVLYGASIILDE